VDRELPVNDPAVGPIFSQLRLQLGRERFERFVNGHAKVNAELLFCTLSVCMSPQAGYSDDALAAMVQDANDLERAAKQHAAGVRRLAKEWRTQRDRPQG
jgi:hypothetical protein